MGKRLTAPEATQMVLTQIPDEGKHTLGNLVSGLVEMRNWLTSDKPAWLLQLIQVVKQARRRPNTDANVVILRIFNEDQVEDRNMIASTTLLTLAQRASYSLPAYNGEVVNWVKLRSILKYHGENRHEI
ncbi:hypothetical protein KSC_029460 [Ktedonobacter sp. SOSP1-52]|uniref:hypothetical protein n=1 Tax=Ktedonobacter sp. SOSP1-52 TaxID=2778366 RepID=UPI0019150FE8|nr:hypothetical protein [Ktedonobacter sp. SOSP1-52]GHO64054.1 hypothetical protein KSC_029460 [Ktedonobacter sp. SOSP1-52]